MGAMTISLRRASLWLSTGLLSWSLTACVAQEPGGDEKEEDEKSDEDGGKKKKKKKKKKGEDEDGKSEDDKDGKDKKDQTKFEKRTVIGTVVDAKGKPVSGVGVGICGTTCLNPVPTNDDGKFEVKGVPTAWKKLKTSVGPGEKFEFFIGSIVLTKPEKTQKKVDLGQLTFITINADDKGTSFKGVKEEKTFKAGKFSFKLDGSNLSSGQYADGLTEGVDNQYFAVAEVPKKIWRDDEKKIEGNKVVSIWGLFPYTAEMNKGSSSLSIDDALGLDDGTELVIYQQDAGLGDISEVGKTKVKDGKIELKEGLTKFGRLYITEK